MIQIMICPFGGMWARLMPDRPNRFPEKMPSYVDRLLRKTEAANRLPRDGEMILPVQNRYPTTDVLKLLWRVLGEVTDNAS
jgi:hypothetical protein